MLHHFQTCDLVSGWRVGTFKDLQGSSFSSYGLAAGVAMAAEATRAAVVGRLLVPCKADALAAPSVGEGVVWNKGGSCPLGFTSVRSLKVYPPVILPSTLSLLTPQKLTWLFLKNTGLVLLLQTNLWLYQALDAEEQALQQGTQAQLPPYPDVLQQLVKAAWNSLRELLTALTRSEIKHAIQRRASRRTAWKILKDPRESLTRKALWYTRTSSWQLLPMYVSTMLRTQLPMYAAELIVACCYDAGEELRRLLYPPAKQMQQAAAVERLLGSEALEQQEQQPARLSLHNLQLQLQQLLVPPDVSHVTGKLLQDCSRRLLTKAGKNVVRVTGTAVCAAVGAGVAASLAPRERAGVWAVRGHIVSDLIFAHILLLLLDGGLAVIFGPPPGSEGQHGPHFGVLHSG